MPPHAQPCTPSELRVPAWTHNLAYITGTLKYSGFCAAMDAANTKPIDRPMMEGEWKKLVKLKAKAGGVTELEVKAGVEQVKGSKDFDVEKYWTSKKFKALFDHNVHLNIGQVDKALPTTAEGHAQRYADLIGAHPEESLRTRK